jgi:hypothetical protein
MQWNSENDTRFEVFTVVKIQIEVFWVLMLCTAEVGHQCFGMKMEAARSSETLISYQNTTQYHKSHLDINYFT